LQASALPLEPYLLHQSIQSQFHWWRNGSHLFEQPRISRVDAIVIACIQMTVRERVSMRFEFQSGLCILR
jgi:hypothetical protein